MFTVAANHQSNSKCSFAKGKTVSLDITTFSSKINKLKRGLGIVWIALGFVTAYYGVFNLGLPNIKSGEQDDLIFGLIMMLIITPVASSGLIMFGKYALSGEYDHQLVPNQVAVVPLEHYHEK